MPSHKIEDGEIDVAIHQKGVLTKLKDTRPQNFSVYCDPIGYGGELSFPQSPGWMKRTPKHMENMENRV